MTRAQDVESYKASPAEDILVDLTPTPLTAVGYGPWVKCFGSAGAAHIELIGGVSPTATVDIEFSNTKIDGTQVSASDGVGYAMTSSVRGIGVPMFTGFSYARLRVIAKSSDVATVCGTIGFGR